jgi:predicted lactoylglutathione lyase
MNGPAFITLGVADIARSKRFYESLFGWKTSSMGNEHVVFFKSDGVCVALYGRQALADDAHLKIDGGFSGVTIAYNVSKKSDVDSIIQRAHDLGASVPKQAEDVFWGGRSGYFRDFDGHVWEIAWNPYITLHAKTVELP